MPNPMDDAVQQAVKQYPWLGQLGKPISLTSGKGPYESESYMPDADENPTKGHYTVELRSDKAKQNTKVWPSLIASESLDWLSRSNPNYQLFQKHFMASMTPDQVTNSWRRYQREQQEHGEKRSFHDFMTGAEVQEYIRGYLFPDAAPGWTGPKGEGRYTPHQEKLLELLKTHLYDSGATKR